MFLTLLKKWQVYELSLQVEETKTKCAKMGMNSEREKMSPITNVWNVK